MLPRDLGDRCSFLNRPRVIVQKTPEGEDSALWERDGNPPILLSSGVAFLTFTIIAPPRSCREDRPRFEPEQ
jgi:hypothetical protein